MASYLKSGFINELSPQLIDAIVDRLQGHPERATQAFFQLGRGAIARVPADATAFPQRHIFGNLLASVGWRHGGDPAPHIQWIRQYWTALEPFTDGFYVNDPDPDASAASINANYRQNSQRLVALKNRYDPANLFRLNTNIRPTARTG
jgi:hypothetical protein